MFCAILAFLCTSAAVLGNAFEKNKEPLGYVSVELSGQFGNQLFQIAAAYAYSLDYNLSLTVPDLLHKDQYNILYNAKKIFLSKIDSYDLPYTPLLCWKEPSFNYSKIPKSSIVELQGYFQSDIYFKHRRNEILDLFAAPPGLNEEILVKYPFLLSDALVVGIQIRDYREERPQGDYHPTISRNYYEKAIESFPKDTIFLVSSNNLKYALECVEGLSSNIIYLEGSDYIEDFYTLVLCKSFIISNSTFGWWASWLSSYNKKTVITPHPWFSLPYDSDSMKTTLLPPEWTVIDYTKYCGAPKNWTVE